MNWEEVGAIGQVLGSIAVFITLVYLSVQTRHARSDSRRALSQGRAEAMRDLYAQGIDERINGLMVKANAGLGDQPPSGFESTLMDRAGLTRDEAIALILYQSSWWNFRVQIITHVNELPAEERRVFDAGIRNQYGRPGVWRLYYEEFAKPVAHPNTLAYVDNLLTQPR
jgi:hypothetical protein